MSESSSLYRTIMKGTALFGGTQVVNILISVLRGKMVAVLLGTVGMGLSSLYMSTLAPLQQFFSMGLPLAVVSVIAAKGLGNETETPEARHELAEQVQAFRRTLLLLTLAGMVFLIVTAPWLSYLTFGDNSQTLAYSVLAVALFFFIMESGETAILQSRRCMRQVAVRGMVNAFASLLVGLPLYACWGQKGIVPALVLSSGAVWAYSRYQTHRLHLSAPRQSWRTSLQLSQGIVALGFMMMLAALLGNLTTYALNALISRLGSMSDVGLYQAATSITSQYVGLVFAAMATDYYPHLSSLTANREKLEQLVRSELETVLYVVAPLVALLILTAPLLIRLLLTEEFLPLTGVVRLMGLAIMCRAVCFPLDYVSMAYGHKRYFFWMEGVWCNLKTLVVMGVSYYVWGLDGLGWGALLSGVVDVIVTIPMTRWFFGVRLSGQLFVLIAGLSLALVLCVLLSFADSSWLSVGASGLLAALLIGGCVYQLSRRLALREWLQRKLHKA